MRSWKVFALAFVATATMMPLTFAQDGKAIKKAMKEAMKGGLCKSVASGEGSADDKKKLYELFADMAKEMPPKGDKASWDAKAGALASAAKAVMEGKEGATAQLKKAANCKACHSEHKGE
jgi:surface antigen